MPPIIDLQAFIQTYNPALPPVVRLWMLRVLSPMGQVRRLVERCNNENEILAALRVDVQSVQDLPSDQRVRALEPLLREAWQQAEVDCALDDEIPIVPTTFAVWQASSGSMPWSGASCSSQGVCTKFRLVG